MLGLAVVLTFTAVFLLVLVAASLGASVQIGRAHV